MFPLSLSARSIEAPPTFFQMYDLFGLDITPNLNTRFEAFRVGAKTYCYRAVPIDEPVLVVAKPAADAPICPLDNLRAATGCQSWNYCESQRIIACRPSPHSADGSCREQLPGGRRLRQ